MTILATPFLELHFDPIRAEARVFYRTAGHRTWCETPFTADDVIHLTDEAACARVVQWLVQGAPCAC